MDIEKAFDNIQHLFMIKRLSKLGIKEIFFHMIKDFSENSQLIVKTCMLSP